MECKMKGCSEEVYNPHEDNYCDYCIDRMIERARKQEEWNFYHPEAQYYNEEK